MMRQGYVRVNNDWRSALEEVKKVRADYAEYADILTPAEHQMMKKAIAQAKDKNMPVILAGVFGEWDTSLANVTKALANVEAAKSAEIRRWDAGKLTGEMQAAKMLLESAISSSQNREQLDPEVMPKLEKIYQEAQASGDLYKQRAAAEIFSGVISMVGNDSDTRMVANRLSQQAKRDADACRAFPELDAAHKAKTEALETAHKALETLYAVDSALGDTKPNGEIGNWDIYKQSGRLREDTDGNIDIRPLEKALQS